MSACRGWHWWVSRGEEEAFSVPFGKFSLPNNGFCLKALVKQEGGKSVGYMNKVSISELGTLKLGLSPFCTLLILGSMKDSDIRPRSCLGVCEDSLIGPLLLF